MNDNSPTIAEVVVGLPVDGPFDYKMDPAQSRTVQLGVRVRVLFNHRECVGVVVGIKSSSEFQRLNEVIDVLDSVPIISPMMLALTRESSRAFGCAWGEMIESALPRYLRKPHFTELDVNLSVDQPLKASGPVSLIHDVEFDEFWKTVVTKIELQRERSKNTLILVPERTYQSTVVKMLKKTFGLEAIECRKAGAVKKEYDQFVDFLKLDDAIVVGTRSAVFCPLQNLGLIIVLQEESEAYRQEQSPHYVAGTVAEFRARLQGAELVYASVNPRVELQHRASQNKWAVTKIEATRTVDFQLVDMNNYNPRKTSPVSFPLQNALKAVIEANGRAIIFLNRRGSGTFTQCNRCQHVMKCRRCETPLISMVSNSMLFCRKCNFRERMPKACPNCRGVNLKSTGRGVERLRDDLSRMYPQVDVDVYDKDTRTFPMKARIIVATSALFQKQSQISAELMAVLRFDQELNRADFRSEHKALTILMNLRRMTTGRLLVQTYMPDTMCLATARSLKFDDFYQHELQTRQDMQLPPFNAMIILMLRAEAEETVIDVCNAFHACLDAQLDDVEVIHPMPDVYPKLRDQYRYNIMVKGESAENMLNDVRRIWREFPRRKNVILSIRVDG